MLTQTQQERPQREALEQQGSGCDNHCGEDQRIPERHSFGNQKGNREGHHPPQSSPADH
jgi:hypothetical protein